MGEPTSYYRFQLSRQAGWRKPEGGIACGRPGPYSNPYLVGQPIPEGGLTPPDDGPLALRSYDGRLDFPDAVRCFEYDLMAGPGRGLVRLTVEQVIAELAGAPARLLVPREAACHVKVLIRVANRLNTSRVPFREGPPW